jgi:hypothetical protein
MARSSIVTLVLLLRELWSRKVLLAVGFIIAALAGVASVYSVSLSPPSLHRSTLDFASAQTQIFVDSESSSLGDLMNDFTPMNARANVYARFLTTPTALRLIGNKAGVPGDQIYAQGPYQLGQARYIQEPTAEKRGQQLIGNRASFRLRFDADPELPIVTMYAEAPTPEQATKLADGSAGALAEYVTRLQADQGISERRRVTIRKLGSSPGAWVSEGAGRKIAVFLFVLVLVLWCGMTIAARRLIAGWRQAGQESVEPLMRPVALPAVGDGHEFRTRPRSHAEHPR